MTPSVGWARNTGSGTSGALLLGVMLLALPCIANAASSEPFYLGIGLGVGFANFGSPAAIYDTTLAPPVETTAHTHNLTTAFSLGYGITPYLALEGGWMSVGSVSVTQRSDESVAIENTVRLKGATVSLVAAIPLAEDSALELAAGAADLHLAAEATLAGVTFPENELERRSRTQTVAQMRLGYLYRLMDQTLLALDVQELFNVGIATGPEATGKATVTAVTFAIRFRF